MSLEHYVVSLFGTGDLRLRKVLEDNLPLDSAVVNTLAYELQGFSFNTKFGQPSL